MIAQCQVNGTKRPAARCRHSGLPQASATSGRVGSASARRDAIGGIGGIGGAMTDAARQPGDRVVAAAQVAARRTSCPAAGSGRCTAPSRKCPDGDRTTVAPAGVAAARSRATKSSSQSSAVRSGSSVSSGTLSTCICARTLSGRAGPQPVQRGYLAAGIETMLRGAHAREQAGSADRARRGLPPVEQDPF
jgi:hypothetical protein